MGRILTEAARLPVRTPGPHSTTRGGVVVRLPSWAQALPALAFDALLLPILNPADTHAAGGDPAVGHLFERIQQTVVLHQGA